MERLISRADYDIRINALKDRFPWLKDAKVRPAPGHIGVLLDLLLAHEEILGRDGVAKAIDFLRITHNERGEPGIFIEYNRKVSQVRAAAVESAKEHAWRSARRVCAACGEDATGLVTSYACEAHGRIHGLFSDDIPDDTLAPAIPPEADLPAEPEVPEAVEAVEPTDEADEPDEEDIDPCIQLFEMEHVERMEKDSKGRDKQERERLLLLAKHMRDSGAYRPLALLPEDIAAFCDQLEADFPNFAEVVGFLRQHFFLNALGDRRVCFPPIMLDGSPGIGKTEFAHALAQRVETGFKVINMGSTQTPSMLGGSERHWSNSDVGEVFRMLAYGTTANPIFLLDELDKMGNRQGYRSEAALYGLLEARTAKNFVDLSVPSLPIDASNVLWIVTTNSLDGLDEAILSRFTRFDVPAPDQAQCKVIAGNLYRRFLEANAWGALFDETLDPAVAERLSHLPPRQIGKELKNAFGRAAMANRLSLLPEDIEAVGSGSVRTHGIGFVWQAANESGRQAA